MASPRPCAITTTDKLTPLLSTLPPELRLDIYALALPFLHHRRSRIIADYISDSHWTATSRAIFLDAAPLVLSKRLLSLHTTLSTRSASLTQHFTALIQRAFPEDHAWVLPLAGEMVLKLGVTVRYGDVSRLYALAERFEVYISGIAATFPFLQRLQMSLGPDFVTSDLTRWGWENCPCGKWRGKCEECGSESAVHESVSWSLWRGHLQVMFELVRKEVPEGCEVVWKFDRAGMPDLQREVVDRGVVLEYLVAFNEWVDREWKLGVV